MKNTNLPLKPLQWGYNLIFNSVKESAMSFILNWNTFSICDNKEAG